MFINNILFYFNLFLGLRLQIDRDYLSSWLLSEFYACARNRKRQPIGCVNPFPMTLRFIKGSIKWCTFNVFLLFIIYLLLFIINIFENRV